MRPIHSLRWLAAATALAATAACGVHNGLAPVTRGAMAPGVRANAWQSYPDAPTARANAAGVAVGFSLYLLGGSGSESAAEVFHAFDSWTAIAPLPTPRTQLMAATVPAERVLAIGGKANGAASAATDMYSQLNSTWERQADMPTARWGAGIASYGVFAYVAGGANASGPVSSVEVFDVRDHAWKKVAPLKLAREGCVAARLGQRLAVAGGRTSGGVTGALSLYNLDTGEWTDGPAMPTPRAYAAYATYGHHLFVLGGRTESGATDVVESYDLLTNTWTARTSLPTPLVGAVASKLGERLVVTGGSADGHASKRTYGTTFPF